jgi:hypothetical protein
VAITFTDWEHSDDPDNPVIAWAHPDVDPAAIRGWPIYIHAEALRQALLERALARQWDPPPAFLTVDLAAGDLSTATWREAFDECLEDVVESGGEDLRFVNHLDNGGDWTGLPGTGDCAPCWTLGDMLAYCTDTTWIAVGVRWPMTAEWAFQRYELLDLLRWSRSPDRTTTVDITLRVRHGDGIDPTEAGAVAKAEADWAVGTWHAEGANQLLGYGSVVTLPGPQYQAHIARARQYWREENLYAGIKHATDFWGFFPGPPDPLGPAVFEGEALGDLALLVPGWNLVTTLPAAASAARDTALLNANDAMPPHPSVVCASRGWWHSPTDGGVPPVPISPVAVFRWDVAGGFTFQ